MFTAIKGTKHHGQYQGYDIESRKAFNDVIVAYAYCNHTLIEKISGETHNQAKEALKKAIDQRLQSDLVEETTVGLFFNHLVEKEFGSSIWIRIDTIDNSLKLVIGNEDEWTSEDLMELGFTQTYSLFHKGKNSQDEDAKVVGSIHRPFYVNLIKNGRYRIRPTNQKDDFGNEIYDLVFDSQIESKQERHQLGELGLSVGSSRK